jgi:hypothetical protein
LRAWGEAIVQVPLKMMPAERRATRSPGKSDPIDAEAVARAALRDPDFPVAQLAGATLVLAELDRRLAGAEVTIAVEPPSEHEIAGVGPVAM